MAQYGGDQQYMKPEGYKTDEYSQNNPLQSTTEGYDIGGRTGTTMQSNTTGYGGTTMGMGGGHGYEEGKHGGTGGILHRTGSGSSSSSEDDGEGGRRKKKGVVEKIKEKLPGGDHGSDEYKTSDTATVGGGGGGGYGYEGEEGHEKKGIMDKIKEKLPGSHQ